MPLFCPDLASWLAWAYRPGIPIPNTSDGRRQSGKDCDGHRPEHGELVLGISGAASQTLYWNMPTPFLGGFGGISPTEAKRIYDDMRGDVQAIRRALGGDALAAAACVGNLRPALRLKSVATWHGRVR